MDQREDGREQRDQRERTADEKKPWYERTWSLLKAAGEDFSDDHASRLAAALACYTLLSFAPLILFCVALASWIFGADATRGQLAGELSGALGQQAGNAVQAVVANAAAPGASALSTVVSAVVLLFGASNVFKELQESLNTVWEVQTKPGRGVSGVIKDRAFSSLVVVVVAILLLASLVAGTTLSAIGKYFSSAIPVPGFFWALNLVVDFGITWLLFAAVFKLIPDAEVGWRDVWVGSGITALLFSLGRLLVGLYLGRAGVTSAYGAAGSLVALVLWVYYSAQIFFFGAELTQAYVRRQGRHIEPSKNAVRHPQQA